MEGWFIVYLNDPLINIHATISEFRVNIVIILLLLFVYIPIEERGFNGRKLKSIKLPFLLQMRWSIFGAAVMSLILGDNWSSESWVSWMVLFVFLITIAKINVKEKVPPCEVKADMQSPSGP